MMKKQELMTLLSLLKQYHAETGDSQAHTLIQNIESTVTAAAAGRKPIYSEDIRRMILRLHDEGGSIRRIAGLTGCSVGYVHKIIHDSSQTGRQR